MQTPATEIPEIILMALCDFFEIRYRLAMKNGRFNFYELRMLRIYESVFLLRIQITKLLGNIQICKFVFICNL